MKLDSEEVYKKIVRLIHYYNMKLYNKRKVQKIKEVLEQE